MNSSSDEDHKRNQIMELRKQLFALKNHITQEIFDALNFELDLLEIKIVENKKVFVPISIKEMECILDF